MEHRDRTALVTGAAGAIGRAAVAGLARAGAHVVMVDKNEEALRDAAAPHAGSVTSVVLDLADPGGVAASLGTVLEARSAVDILVNSAGILSNSKLADTTWADLRAIQQINVDAAVLLTQAVVPGMLNKGWGRIINITSYAAKCGGLTAGTGYTISKSGLIGLTFSVAREFAAHGITVNGLAPAYVMSPMVSEALSEAERASLLEAIPVHRFCAPEEVAHAIEFLASEKAGFITGEIIDMNGGLQFD